MRNTITTTIVLATAALALTACQGPAIGMNADCTDPTALSIIVAAHGNAAPALPAEVSCMVRKAVENGKPISIIREDGAPSAAQSPASTLSIRPPKKTTSTTPKSPSPAPSSQCRLRPTGTILSPPSTSQHG
ncbi:hypothetical protein NHF46_11665 [Arthrobacter alpinus]|nr:hypothetical protein [Arthrobacter alpinus]